MKKIEVVLVLFYDHEGNILMHQRDDSPDFWSLLGGSVEENELPSDAISREMFEEIALSADHPYSFVKTYQHTISEDKYCEFHLFEADFPGFDKLKDSEEVKLTELKLFSPTEVLTLKTLPFTTVIFSDFSAIRRNT